MSMRGVAFPESGDRHSLPGGSNPDLDRQILVAFVHIDNVVYMFGVENGIFHIHIVVADDFSRFHARLQLCPGDFDDRTLVFAGGFRQ